MIYIKNISNERNPYFLLKANKLSTRHKIILVLLKKSAVVKQEEEKDEFKSSWPS
jgi:hypothetical protein